MSGTGTPRLYFDDSLACRFEAEVVSHATLAGKPSVILARTAFYPEAGGQMADRGTLAGLPVVDVQVDDADLVHHVVAGELPAVGTTVAGVIDRARRRAHMSLHTGQHMLSAALVEAAEAHTVSSRLGETLCTIDVNVEKLDEARLSAAEALANAVVDDDVAIRAFFPAAGELEALKLRRTPKVAENVRVVQVGDFDLSPCGGTHCSRSAQVGLIRVTQVERYKGMTRISFTAGPRARAELGADSAALRSMARQMSCGPGDVAAQVDKLRGELAEARTALGHARGKLAESVAAEMLASPEPRVVGVWDGVDVDFLRAVAKRVVQEKERVAFLAARETDGLRVLVARGPGSDFDCGAWLKRVASAHGGRGGGGQDRAEGRLPAGADWAAAARS